MTLTHSQGHRSTDNKSESLNIITSLIIVYPFKFSVNLPLVKRL